MSHFLSVLPFYFLIQLIKSLVLALPLLVIFKVGKAKKAKHYLLASILIIFTVLVSINFEYYFAPFPFIDTKFTEGFTLNGWSSIVPGMTREEIEEKIGKGYPNGPYSEIVQPGDTSCIGYSSDGRVEPLADFAWIGIGVCYDENGVVTRTYQNVIHD